MSGALFDIKILEGALNWWEDVAFCYNTFRHGNTMRRITKSDAVNLLKFPGLFRDQLLAAASSEKTSYDERFLFGKTNELEALLNPLGTAFYSWNRLSRRVFSVSDELRVMLEATSFRSVTWGDVPWPFDSFMLTFEKPIELFGSCSIGAVIWVHNTATDEGKVSRDLMVLLPSGLDGYEPSTLKQREQYLRLLQRGDVPATEKWMKRWDENVCRDAHSPGQMDVAIGDAVSISIEQRICTKMLFVGDEQAKYYRPERVCEIARIVAAFSFYLTTLPIGSPERAQHVRPGPIPPAIKRNDPRLVSLKSNVCRVTSSFTLTFDEQEEIEAALARERTGEVVPHWCRAHFRRPPGKGGDPTVQRTVWVKAHFNNRRHLPDGVLPGGALVRVLAPENDMELGVI